MITASGEPRGETMAARHGGSVAPLHDSATDQLIAIFKALGEKSRMEVFRLVLEHGEIGCTELEERLSVSKSTISYHVKTLYQAGLIEIQRRGRFFHYYLRQDVADRYVPFLAGILSSEF
ncbi:helix-turn-helix domain-containing protein [Pseudonocardia kujensis]|uniref:ArsR/SmtB family transcription factor n=1 Tax=Pseudonocardia kujensis TaxID=1128675 RepID=UPI001E5180A2|nr:helix-turn-helix domain-containing protein [Pseudonocardia kujensis]MCE0764954.1 helix-turn-helix domain-containing protein [Pseudonocardia kujensis]